MMESHLIENITWFTDQAAGEAGEPGIHHSYMKSVATALNYLDEKFDPVWLMGSSGFAFRIFINVNLCPSAMSIFDFSAILPEVIEQSGYRAAYFGRYWNDEAHEKIRRDQAHEAILAGIDRNVPAVVWDIYDAEWGLITGYNARGKFYHTLTHRGEKSTLPFARLGRNGIDILSVAIAGEPNQKTRDEIVFNALKAAVCHAEQGEWTERGRYQNGLAAYEMWSAFYEKAAMIINAGKGANIKQDVWDHAAYHASHHYSARCYARDFLKMIAPGNDALAAAASLYETAASLLKLVWYAMVINRNLNADTLNFLAQQIREAKQAEEKGIRQINAYLKIST
ncbi:MAG: hypothetical protein ACOY90_23205 [Candidatus Zhuqueibacterota bacterium]